MRRRVFALDRQPRAFPIRALFASSLLHHRVALGVLLPLAILIAGLAAAAWLDVRRGGWMRVAWGAAVPATLLALAGVIALRSAWIVGGEVSEGAYLAGVALTAASAAALAILAKLLPARRWAFALAALPLFLAPLGFLVPALAPWGFGLASIAGAAVWPWALSRGLRAGGGRQWAAVAAGAGLGLGLVGGALFLLIEVGDGTAGGPAVHRWTLTVEPDGEGAWNLQAPYFVTEDALDSTLRGPMTDTLAIREGEATFELDDRGVVTLHGRGRVVLEARHAFYGEGREAFHAWRVTDAPFLLQGVAAASVEWEADFSGGTGHTCWARDAFTVPLEEGVPVDAPTGREDRRVQAACA